MIRELHCSSCGVELTGGLDTYGNPGLEICERCFSSGELPGSVRADKLAELEDLKTRASDIQDELSDLEMEYSGVMDDIWKLKNELGMNPSRKQPVVIEVQS